MHYRYAPYSNPLHQVQVSSVYIYIYIYTHTQLWPASLTLPTLWLWCRWAASRGSSRKLGVRAAPPGLGLGIPVPGASYCCLQVTLQPCVAPTTSVAIQPVSRFMLRLQEPSFYFILFFFGCDMRFYYWVMAALHKQYYSPAVFFSWTQNTYYYLLFVEIG